MSNRAAVRPRPVHAHSPHYYVPADSSSQSIDLLILKIAQIEVSFAAITPDMTVAMAKFSDSGERG